MSDIIDGKLVAGIVKEGVKKDAEKFSELYGRKVCLAVILVGNDSASQVYVNNKIKSCEAVGIKSLSFRLPEETTQEEIEDLIKGLAEDGTVDGILVQLPLPKRLNTDRILSFIPIEKDVDGFLPANIGNLSMQKDCVTACTPSGVMKLLEYYHIPLAGKHAVIIGRSNIVGKPMAMLLLNADCTITQCHSKTEGLKSICKTADIIISAVGKEKIVTADMVKKGAVVIDIGIIRKDNRISGNTLTGDVDFEKVSKKASFITPVPGGVGPMTIAMLMENTVKCAFRRKN